MRGLQTLRLPISCVESKAIDTVEFCFQRVRERSDIVCREKIKRGQQSTVLVFFFQEKGTRRQIGVPMLQRRLFSRNLEKPNGVFSSDMVGVLKLD